MGADPIWPQVLSLMAFVSTVFAFPVFDWDDETRNFMCIRFSVGGSDNYGCSPLRLSDPAFWADSDAKGWAAAIQTAAFFGVVACAAGFIVLCQLMIATCFVLKPRHLLMCVCLQVACIVLCIFTLVAGAADICKLAGTASCDKKGVHISTGAGFMLFGFFAHIAALVMTTLFFVKVRNESLPSCPGGGDSEFDGRRRRPSH